MNYPLNVVFYIIDLQTPIPAVSGVYLCHHGLDTGFDEYGGQRSPLLARIIGQLPALDVLLSRSGWRLAPVPGDDPLLHHHLVAEDFRGA